MLNSALTVQALQTAKTPNLIACLTLWSQRAKQRRALKSLTPEQLADIGVCHKSLINEVSKPFWVS